LDSAGNFYIADTQNSRIRKVAAATGIITTVAGTGIYGSGGDGGPAIAATIASPRGIAVDASGNIYLANVGNDSIRKVAAATGIITRVAGNGVSGYSGDGGAAINAQLNSPEGVALDSFGNIYIADAGNHRVRRVWAVNGIITTIAGNGIWGYSGDGGPATAAQLYFPRAVLVDASGNVLIADNRNSRIRRVSAGTIMTLAGNGGLGSAGDGGPAISAQLYYASALATDGAGNLYVADNTKIRKVSSDDGYISTVAGNGTSGYFGDGGPAANAQARNPFGVALDGGGNLYIADPANHVVRKVMSATGTISTIAGNGTRGFSGDGSSAASSQLNYPQGLVVDGAGNLYIADYDNNRVRKITAGTGAITTVAGNGDFGPSGDGGPAISAALNGPSGLALDGSGNLYIADTRSGRIRRISIATGVITTVAGNGTWGTLLGDGGPATSARLNWPTSVAVDNQGNLYIADGGNQTIRKVWAASGIITMVAGIGENLNVAIDGSGDLFIADCTRGRIHKLSVTSGIMTTVAGTGGFGPNGDGGPATNATLHCPSGMALDSSGTIYFADTYNGLVRFLTPAAGRALLSVSKTHSGNFTPGQTGAKYSLAVRNSAFAGATSGTVTVSEIVPAGLSLQSMSGVGWNCPPGGSTCTRNDVLLPGSSYPSITVAVNDG
jgi:uncharacterized repeat protein (TIGR01451 family)